MSLIGGLVVVAVAVFLALWFYFWVWKPARKWRDVFLGEATLVLARLQEEKLHQKVAELLILSLWRMEPSKPIRELLETYAGKKMEEVYAEYGLPQA